MGVYDEYVLSEPTEQDLADIGPRKKKQRMPSTLDIALSKMSLPADTKTVREKHPSIQIYGEPGTGKTITGLKLAQAITPPEKSILYIDSRNGIESAEDPKWAYLLDGVVRLAQTEWADVDAAADLIQAGQAGDIGTVIFDEFSTMCDGLLDELWRVDVGARPGVSPVREVETKLYKPMQDAVMRTLTKFQRLGLNLILLAHTRTDTDHRKVVVRSPGYTPKNGTNISKALTVSAYISAEVVGNGKYKRKVQSWPSALVSTKSRIGSLPFETDPDSFVTILSEYMQGDEQPVDENRPLGLDELPGDGVPVADFDEPVVVDE